MPLNSTINYNISVTQFKKEINYLKPYNNLQRKKSLSLSVLPIQNNQFLCVPLAGSQQICDKKELCKSRSTDDLRLKREKSFESLKKLVSQTSLTIPENFSFQSLEIQVYKIRWVLLALIAADTAVSYMQWIQYSIIANIIMKYYNIDSVTVDWTSMIFMITYVLFVIPISYIMDCRGLRQTAVIGSVGTAIGAWIKVFSLKSDQFAIALLGQGVVAISQIFVLSVPIRLAKIWFSPEQMSLVCAFGVSGAQLGIALGFFVTPLLVHNHLDPKDIHQNLQVLLIGTAGISTFIAILIVGMFESAPPNPPSHVEAIARSTKITNKGFWRAVIKLLKSWNYMILVIAYGINVGVFNSFSTLLNQIVLNYFPNSEEDAGKVGMALIVVGLGGSVVFGFFMDTMHKFTETAVWVCKLTSIAMVMFCLALESRSKILLSVASILLGFFMTGFQPVGYELAAEITFPEPDGPVAGIMTISTHVFGIAITLVISRIQNSFGELVGNLCFALLLMFGSVAVSLVKPDLKRHYAHTEIAEVAKELLETKDVDYFDENAPLKFKIDEVS